MDMDEFVWPASSCDPPPFQESSVSVSTVSHHQHPSLDFMSSDDVPEQWLLGDDDVLDHRRAVQPPPPLLIQTTTTTTRGTRKQPGARTDGHVTTTSHVEAERQRRDRLNRRFCDLRAAVPRVTRMDKASILADAVAYIAELRGRVDHLEKAAVASLPPSFGSSHDDHHERFALEARMIGPEAAALRLRMAAERHSPARLMAALRALDLPVQHACVCRVGGVTVQDVVVDVPAAGLRGDGRLRAALHGLLLQESC
ncbi:hypothetical protein HU200_055445 [Digitaria exilis]|uniref:Transcription factor n=1 Tax=Digitaria exilis TaxID=1010633 RepID=A0A835E2Y2_9POAL|nr:hypothetical protein HU200_055445 [Digitaria exilis]CAB3472262.1 unnamed protein product [Digitaria exilis]